MTDPILEALQIQRRAKEEGVDPFEIISRELKEEELKGYDNPFLDEQGNPYHDTPEKV